MTRQPGNIRYTHIIDQAASPVFSNKIEFISDRTGKTTVVSEDQVTRGAVKGIGPLSTLFRGHFLG